MFTVLSLNFSRFLTPDIPNEVQYFAWAPEGNKLVSMDRQIIGHALNDSWALKWVIDEVVKHNLVQTLEQRKKG